MSTQAAEFTLSDLYELDETAWLETMSRLAAEGRSDQLDLIHLSEYLSDMAKRDRREVQNRLTVLLSHLLKWEYQPDRRNKSWQLTIAEQQRELQLLLESRSLHNHALNELPRIYARAVKEASIETGLTPETFPATCPFALDAALGEV